MAILGVAIHAEVLTGQLHVTGKLLQSLMHVIIGKTSNHKVNVLGVLVEEGVTHSTANNEYLTTGSQKRPASSPSYRVSSDQLIDVVTNICSRQLSLLSFVVF